ncbi:ABC transporter ATP-binding protein [Undibacterium seohonense]|uniref:ABC transporter ATP-binding protein n=1 Tax=Undibacterium seohonense TaxID=1344950 RepID=A0ABR6WZN2_9BURK|nr:ABC transporter ATP-binding protein [Undibacterium seohonense]MBC3806040.1 ABC transporter ATP-binding protein [Undibacterium seohonense]
MSVLQLHQVKLRIGDTDILRGVDLELKAGEVLALIGPNGAGKSSLFDVISGRQSGNSGQIFLQGTQINGLTTHKIARLGLSRSFQTSQLFLGMSVFAHLCCAAMARYGSPYLFWRRLKAQQQVIIAAESMLDLIGLRDRQDVVAGVLPYAEQRRLEIGMSLIGEGSCILLDEPTAGMSRTEAKEMIALLKQISLGKSLLIVEHDLQVVFALADRIAVMVQGEIIACDTPENIRANALVQAAYLSEKAFQAPATILATSEGA